MVDDPPPTDPASQAERYAADRVFMECLEMAVSKDPTRTRPEPFTIAILIQRGWLTLRPGATPGAYEAFLTRAGRRELELYRQRRWRS